METIQYIVKLARVGGNWKTLSDVKTWRYVSDITEEGSEITVYEHSADRADARHFSKLRALDVVKAARGTAYFGFLQAVTVYRDVRAIDAPAVPTPVHTPTLAPRTRKAKAVPVTRFCKVHLPGRRSLILDHASIGDRWISGTLDGSHVVMLLDCVRVEPLAANCHGELVPVADSCKCGQTQALAVEHGRNW